ncbi:phosphorylated adapter RNA export protein isoform X2 [Conger conger]|uniref:phosphorylated adapter RNA export protein isoform X2 n=1 Tax=Conger conger TaxID=82655 RepID=UPI002A5B0449|nr:phosphorylated adapter RNA export protein isoform X2 [Conger conger]
MFSPEVCRAGSDQGQLIKMVRLLEDKKPATATAFTGHAFRSRGPPPRQQTVAAGYRSTAAGVASSGSDSDSEEEASLWRRKRQRCSNVPPPPQAPPPSSARHGAPPSRKVNNIWGCVVQEQTQEAVAAELGIMGMEGAVSMSSRQCETYNYVLARKLMEKEREQEEQGEAAMLDSQLDDYMQGRGGEGEGEGEGEGRGGAGEQPKRKRPARDRLGPRAEMDFEGRYQITEEDPDDKVTDEIVHRLREPKKDLIERVVSVVGKKKAIELLAETATVEQNGGIFTMDGSRRRTPGGVYLNLLKNTPSISGKQVKKIFYDETQRETSSRKAAKKRRRHEICRKMKQAINALDLQEHDDVSRETFASDTNEALESLEDPAEPGPPEPEPQFSLGGEDAAVVYSSTDLEVF